MFFIYHVSSRLQSATTSVPRQLADTCIPSVDLNAYIFWIIKVVPKYIFVPWVLHWHIMAELDLVDQLESYFTWVFDGGLFTCQGW